MRVVSLVPSLTELVVWLGREESLMGRTRFCVEPAGAVEHVPVVGGTKNPKVERIVALAPDLVLANREENRREDIEALEAAGLEVLLTDPNTVAEAAAMIREVGARVGAAGAANALAERIESMLAEAVPGRGPRVFVPIWKEPLMGLGGAAYGHDLIEQAGAVNVLRDRARYPEVSLEEVAELAPDLVLLPDEPYPFKEADAAYFAGVAPARVVDGRLLWWYGPRIPEALDFLRTLFGEGKR
ncbi:MAG: ABC transporter substrate-binding protein [Dehalococcoidia bacterium]|nr:ABC transporter substrate-binding protein [Dehalococcoidia bacterium]